MKKGNQPNGAMLREVARLLLQLQRTQVASCSGTTSTQCFILGEIGRAGSLTLAELGRRLALDKGWLSRAVDSLEHEGLVNKLLGEADRRTIVISLSRDGKARYEELNRILNRQSAQVLSRVPSKNRPAIYDSLKHLYDALQAEAASVASPREKQSSCAVEQLSTGVMKRRTRKKTGR